MYDRLDPKNFASQLLRQDIPLSDSQYREYRQKLEEALRAAERRERLAYRVVLGSCVVMLALMFLGGSRWLGAFDPWSKDATIMSVVAGVVYLFATVTFFLTLASYYSRFRPRVRDTKEQLRDLALLDLQRQLCELREQVRQSSYRDIPGSEPPKSG